MCATAATVSTEMREWRAHQRQLRQQRPSRRRRGDEQGTRQARQRRAQRSLLREWLDIKWAKHWKAQGRNKPGTTWSEAWQRRPGRLYDGLTKPQATALFLLRTEAIGLNKWLATRRVPGIDKSCPCGFREQSVYHVIFRCPRHDMIAIRQRLRAEDVATALGDPVSAGQVARWVIQQGILQQFSVARDLEQENRSEYQAVLGLSEWVD